MRLPRASVSRPRSVEEVLAILRDHGDGARLLAGGTDLVPNMKKRLVTPTRLVALNGVDELRGIRFEPAEGLWLGSMTTITEVSASAPVQEHYPMLAAAAHVLAAPQLRNAGTVGGNVLLDTRCYHYNQGPGWRGTRPLCVKAGGEVCNALGRGRTCYACWSADLATMLVTLGAVAKVVSPACAREIPLSGLYTGDGASPFTIEPTEVILSLRVPRPLPGTVGAYRKFRRRNSLDFPLAATAITVSPPGQGRRAVRVALGAVASDPRLVITELPDSDASAGDLAEAVEGVVQACLQRARPVNNVVGATPAHRRHMVGEMVRRTLTELTAVPATTLNPRSE